MDRAPVTSSTIRSIGYDTGASLLEVEFKSGAIYRYAGVPVMHHRGILSADSPGKYLNKYIKDHFSCSAIK
jgi:hypothetical protein